MAGADRRRDLAYPDEARLAVAIAAWAAAAAAAAGSSLAGIEAPACMLFFENAAIMIRASRFIASIFIAENSERHPWLLMARCKRTPAAATEGRDLSSLRLFGLERFQDLQRLIRRAADFHGVTAVAQDLVSDRLGIIDNRRLSRARC